MTSEIEDFLTNAPVFFQPWWLEAVSPGAWNYAISRRGEEIAALMPYTYKLKFNRWTLIEMPKLTPYLGPYLRDSNAKPSKRLAEEKDLMSELIDTLPPYASFQMGFHPCITNWLPFYWRKFSATPRYTYIIPNTHNVDAIWDGFRQNIRSDIRKAEKLTTVSLTDDFDIFLHLHKATFKRQGKELPHSEELLKTMNHKATENDVRSILIAKDTNGTPHAAIYILHDKTTDYYLLSGSDPSLRNSGAISLLLWTAIQNASLKGKSFDFEGSMVEPIERFVRAFGAVQTPYFEVTHTPSHVVSMYRSILKTLRR